MANKRHLFTSAAGVSYTWEDTEDGGYLIHGKADHAAVLDYNKAQFNHNDGYTPSRELRRVASIPLHLMVQWLQEEGWWALNPEHSDRLVRKLNDPDYAYLRTAPGRVAALPDGGFR